MRELSSASRAAAPERVAEARARAARDLLQRIAVLEDRIRAAQARKDAVRAAGNRGREPSLDVGQSARRVSASSAASTTSVSDEQALRELRFERQCLQELIAIERLKKELEVLRGGAALATSGAQGFPVQTPPVSVAGLVERGRSATVETAASFDSTSIVVKAAGSAGRSAWVSSSRPNRDASARALAPNLTVTERTQDVRPPSPVIYNPKGGFAIVLDYAQMQNMEKAPGCTHATLAYGLLSNGVLQSATLQSMPILIGPDGKCVFDLLRTFRHNVELSTCTRLMVELRAQKLPEANAPPETVCSLGWASLPVFTDDGRLLIGAWRTQLNAPPVSLSNTSSDAALAPASLYFRVVSGTELNAQPPAVCDPSRSGESQYLAVPAPLG